jgi:hypothetical protein
LADHASDTLLDRIDDLASEIADGHLKVESDRETILSLSITEAGRAILLPTLPTATARNYSMILCRQIHFLFDSGQKIQTKQFARTD